MHLLKPETSTCLSVVRSCNGTTVSWTQSSTNIEFNPLIIIGLFCYLHIMVKRTNFWKYVEARTLSSGDFFYIPYFRE
jgi:hypothetical protein